MVSHFPSLRERFFSDGGALETVSVTATGETQPLPPAAHPGVVERVAHTSSILGDSELLCVVGSLPCVSRVTLLICGIIGSHVHIRDC